MQTANVFVALGGRRQNSVPKYGVTAAEVAVLRLIHGEDAVYDIDVQGEVSRTHRQEIARLAQIYGRQEGENRVSPAVNTLFPGAAARVFETFDELELPEDLFAVQERKTAAPRGAPMGVGTELAMGEAAAYARTSKGLDGMTLNELRAHADKIGLDLTGVTRKADVLEAVKLREANLAAQLEDDEQDDEDDNTGDLNDEFTEQPASVFG